MRPITRLRFRTASTACGHRHCSRQLHLTIARSRFLHGLARRLLGWTVARHRPTPGRPSRLGGDAMQPAASLPATRTSAWTGIAWGFFALAVVASVLVGVFSLASRDVAA